MFTIQNCVDRGCMKVVKIHEMVLAGHSLCLRKCSAYNAPAKLVWHRQDKPCPLAPYQGSDKKAAVKINPLKASKRSAR